MNLKRHIEGAAGLILWGALACSRAGADTTINEIHYAAHGANIGWINARGDITHGAVMGRFVCSGYLYSGNVGWIHLGNGAPTNGYEYGNTATNDYGVNHDGLGHLSGLAYGANIGWIRFESSGDPRLDMETGAMDGYAHGANIGWIGLSNLYGFLQTDALDAGPDTDGDGIPDPWEIREAGELSILQADHDEDEDGALDAEEYGSDTGPLDDGSLLYLTSIAVTGQTADVEWTSESTRHYYLIQADSLTNPVAWADSGEGLITDGAIPTTRRTLDVTDVTGRYYRVQAVVPLAP